MDMWQNTDARNNNDLSFLRSFQQNSTKYLKNIKIIDKVLENQLKVCAGEIFLSCIPATTSIEEIAKVVSIIGEIYILRFKVNYSGESRGIAYLQYMDPDLMHVAITKLPVLFEQHSLPMIRVFASRNNSKLILKRISNNMQPQDVFHTLKNLVQFKKLICAKVFENYYEYEITFECNEDAVHGRRELLRSIQLFGPTAIITWDNNKSRNHINKMNENVPMQIIEMNNPMETPTLLRNDSETAVGVNSPCMTLINRYKQNNNKI